MFEIERELILRMVQLMPKHGISYERFGGENPYIVCAKTLENYATENRKFRPTDKKLTMVLQTLKKNYIHEYNDMIKIILKEYHAESIKQIIIDRLGTELELTYSKF